MDPDAIAQLSRERDLFLRLLELGSETRLDEFANKALRLAVEASGATHGYLELLSRAGDSLTWTASGFSDVEVVRAQASVSKGIIAQAIALGEPILTTSAHRDPRFREMKSVREASIEAVLCVPIGMSEPFGVVYLARDAQKGGFDPVDRDLAILVSRHLAPIAELRVMSVELSGKDYTLEARSKLLADDIIGSSKVLAAVLNEAALVARLDVNVLITGETGTGKSQLARVLHESSGRSGKPFLEVSCATIPMDLFENELFGAERGAHSTAQIAIKGKVAEAQGGTLFLDEIGEIPLASQAKLLQLMQSREYYPLGASRPLRADLRVLAASNVDLEQSVRDGSFREDLFYRLSVLPIRMPSLSERRNDIPELASAICETICKRHDLPHLTLSVGAGQSLMMAEWPGNIRQLANCLEAAAVRAGGEGALVIQARHLFPKAPDQETDLKTLQGATRQFQRHLVRSTLVATQWNVTEAALRLDVARTYVYKLIHSLGVERDKGQRQG